MRGPATVSCDFGADITFRAIASGRAVDRTEAPVITMRDAKVVGSGICRLTNVVFSARIAKVDMLRQADVEHFWQGLLVLYACPALWTILDATLRANLSVLRLDAIAAHAIGVIFTVAAQTSTSGGSSPATSVGFTVSVPVSAGGT